MQSIPLIREAASSRISLAQPTPQQAMIVLGLLLTATVLATECWRYLRLDAYLDHIEGNVAIGGWLWAHDGAPLYATWDGIARFANYYGPLAYLAPVPALLLLGPGIIASKVPAILALVATLGLTACRFRRAAPTAAIHGMFLMTAGFVALSPMSFWMRPDSFETLLVAVALATAASPVCVGLCIGLAVNFKIHAFVYFLPILWELWRRDGWRTAPPVMIVSFATFLAPFLLPGISFHDYVVPLAEIVGSRKHLGDASILVLAYTIALALPVVLPLCRRHIEAADRSFAIAALLALAVTLYPASFSGSGPYHFLPLLPMLAEVRKRLAPAGIGAEFAVFPLLFLAAITTHLSLAQMMERQDWHAVADDALALAQEAPKGTVEIGYGDNRRSYEIVQLAKTVLSLHGYPRQLDAQLLMELHESGIDGSRRWVPYLTECRIGRWLLPRDEEPFVTRAYYYDNEGLVFDEAFRAAFAAHYRPVATSEHFTVWECRDHG